MSDAKDTNVTFHGGNTAGGATVQLIFWGADWNGSESGLRLNLINAAMNVIDGPFYSALSQYNLARPVFGHRQPALTISTGRAIHVWHASRN